MFFCYFANCNEFLRDSSRIEPIPPNIRNDIVSEWELTRRTSRLEKFFLMKPHESPRINKKSIRGDSWPVWNIPLFHTAPNPTNCHELTNIWIRD